MDLQLLVACEAITCVSAVLALSVPLRANRQRENRRRHGGGPQPGNMTMDYPRLFQTLWIMRILLGFFTVIPFVSLYSLKKLDGLRYLVLLGIFLSTLSEVRLMPLGIFCVY